MTHEVADLNSGEGILLQLILQGDSITMLHPSLYCTSSSCCTQHCVAPHHHVVPNTVLHLITDLLSSLCCTHHTMSIITALHHVAPSRHVHHQCVAPSHHVHYHCAAPCCTITHSMHTAIHHHYAAAIHHVVAFITSCCTSLHHTAPYYIMLHLIISCCLQTKIAAPRWS